MFSRLTQGVSSVLHELSGEDRFDGDFQQDGPVPQPRPDAEASLEGTEGSEEVLERLAQTEQLVVQLKELIREKDSQLASTEKKLKEEKEQAEVKFTKLKLQAKAKTAALNKQLSELKGKEALNSSQDGPVPQPRPDAEASLEGTEGSEEVLERLAQTEQLVVQLKELIREKDSQLASTEKKLKEEKEQAEVKFTKLKLQAKAKTAALNKQLNELKGKEALNSSQNSESSFQMAPEVEEELQQLKEKLSQAESTNMSLQHQLWEAEQRVREEGHAEQVRILQTVVREKDVRFQEQILKHEQELLNLTQVSNDLDLQQALRVSQQRIEELEESLRSRSEVLEMLQQELNSADQQKQILTAQFRQMELELAEARRLREEERQQWAMRAEEELQALRARLEASGSEGEQTVNSLNTELRKKTTETDEMRAKLESAGREKEEMLEKLKDKENAFEAELAKMKACLEARLETSESEREQIISTLNINVTQLNAELLKKTTEMDEMRAKLESGEREKEEMLEKVRQRESAFEAELTNLKVSLETRLEASEKERDQNISALNAELLKKTAEVDEIREKLDSGQREKEEMLEKLKDKENAFEAEMAKMKACLEARLETSESEREQIISTLNINVTQLNAELLKKTTEMDEMRAKLESGEREKEEMLEKMKERESSFEAELTNLKVSLETRLEASEKERDQNISALNAELVKKTAEVDEIRANLESGQREKEEMLEKIKERECAFEAELAKMKACLEARLETSESEREQIISTLNINVTQLNAELVKKTTELDEMRAKLESGEREKEEMVEKVRQRESAFEADLTNLKVSLETRLEASEKERDQNISALNAELVKKTAEMDELRAKLESGEREKEEMLEKMKERESSFEAELTNLKVSLETRLETSEMERDQNISALNAELVKKTAETDEIRAKLESGQREKEEMLEKLKDKENAFEAEMAKMKACLEARLESSESEREQIISTLNINVTQLNAELLKKTTEMDEMRAKLESGEREKEEMLEKMKERESSFEAELTNLKVSLETRLETLENERNQNISALNAELVKKTTEVDEIRAKLESAEREREEMLEKIKGRECAFEAELAKMKACLEARLETSESEREQIISTLNINVTQLNAELLKKTTEMDEMRAKLESGEREKEEMLEKMKERESSFEAELTNLKVSLETRLETLENERNQNISALNAELLKKTAEMGELRAKLEYEEREKNEMLEKLKDKENAFEAELAKMKVSLEARLEFTESEKEQTISALNAELQRKTTEVDEIRSKFESGQRENEQILEKLKERECAFEAELTKIKESLETRLEMLENESNQNISALNSELLKKTAETDEMRAKLASVKREKEEMLEKLKDKENAFEAELAKMKACLEARLETSESEREQIISTLNINVTQLNAELVKKATELDEMRARLESGEREKEEMVEKLREREFSFEAELTNLKVSLETRLEASEKERDQNISALNAELVKKTAEMDELRAKLESGQREKEEMLVKIRESENTFESELTNLKVSLEAKLETTESEKEQTISALYAEILKKGAEVDEMRSKLESEEREKEEMLEKFKERETSFDAELTNLKASLEARLETTESEKVQTISALNAELLKTAMELDEMRAKSQSEEREKNKMLEKFKERETSFAEELTNLKVSLEARMETTESEKEQTISALNAELLKKTTEFDELREKLSDEKREILEMLQERQIRFETELANLQACLEVAESQKEEMTKKLEVEVASRMEELHHLQEKLNEVERAREEESKNERNRLAQMQNELESLRETLDANKEEQKAGLQAKDALENLWRGIQNLTTPGEAEVEISIPTHPAQFLKVLPALEARLSNLTDEQQESQACMSQITLTLQSLQGQLDKSTAEKEKAVARIQELEQQLLTVQVTGESLRDHVTDLSVRDLDRTHQDNSGDAHRSEYKFQSDRVLFLELQLADREKELFDLKEKLSLTTGKTISEEERADSQSREDIAGLHDNSTALSEVLEGTQEEETTLVAVDTSVLSVSAGNESSPEIIAPQPVSPGESKGTSSDEMVTSSDSEVPHSSWTLLEAVNQDGTKEWAPQIQDFASLRLSTQSWEETCEEHVASTSCLVDIESPSLVIRETVQIRLGQQEGSLLNTDSNTGQAFAQVLAEEIQKRYSELLGELQQFKDTALQSQERVFQLEEELRSLTDSKNEVQCKADIYKKELIEVKALFEQEKIDRQNVAEQFENLQEEAFSKDDKMKALQESLDEVHQRLFEQEGQARMLAAQLEDRELTSSELEQKLVDMEGRLVQISHEADIAKAALIDRTADLEGLQKCLSQKDQEMMELNESMTAKLLQAGEERFTMSSEVKKLKEQIHELEIVRDYQQKILEDKTSECEELVALRKENDDLNTQMAALKKNGEQVKRKLQAALIQRKELIKKVADFEKEAEIKEEKERDGTEEITLQFKNEIKEKEREIQRLDVLLQETRDDLNIKEETLTSLKQKISKQDQALTESRAEIEHLTERYVQLNEQQMSQMAEDRNRLLSQIASMESDIEILHKKLQESTDANEDTVVKAQENDRHHLEQMKQQKEEYSDLFERLQTEEREKNGLLNRIVELEGLLESKNDTDKVNSVNVEGNVGSATQNLEKPKTNDWVDFTSAETKTQQHKPGEQSQQPVVKDHEDIINGLQEELRVEQAARAELEVRLQESQSSQSLTDSKFKELCKELEVLREKERQIDALTDEMEAIREKCQRAEANAEKLKVEVDEAWEAAKRSISDAESPVKALQSEVEEFKQFLKHKNDEIVDLSQQLSEQSSLLLKMQETVLEKDQLIASLQEGLKAEQDKVKKLEAEMPQHDEEEKDYNAKLQQLQRKLQAALVSRKEALKQKQLLKEEQTAAEKIKLELQQKLELIEVELNKSREEREKLIEEVDRTLLENQSLRASCESLKLAMEGVLNEKDACKRQAESAKEESDQVCRQLEEKVQSMKEEYESLLKSYENVSDEAERVRRVLEAARQERQELAAKARAHEAARHEAERLAEEAMKEVDVVKEKMRKFAKVKHQKIMDLEEENERLREQEEKKLTKHTDTELKQDLESVKQELETLKTNYNIVLGEKNFLEHEAEELRLRLAEDIDKKDSENLDTCSVETIKEVKNFTQQRSPDVIEIQEYQSDSIALEANPTEPLESIGTALEQMMQSNVEMTAQTEERLKELETSLKTAENKIRELEAALEDHMESRNKQESMLNAEIASFKQQLQESSEREGLQKEELYKKETQLQELRASLETERDDLEEQLMNQLAQLNGSIAGYQQEASDSRDRLTDMQRELEKLERERAELEAEVASERDRAARMEEDMRQAQRERAEAESEAGKQRELEQKLKSAQRFKDGSQNRTRQLEELLREKQMEVRQLQKDCIEYQERISELGKDVKSLTLGRVEVSAELDAARLEIVKIMQDRTSIASELSMCKGKLDMALEEAKQAQADKIAAEKMVQLKEAELKADAERTLDEVRYRLGAELKQMELRLEKSYRERERVEEATLEARSINEAADRHSQEMQARLDEALARLAAFSRSMSSLQDDRDRVLDEAKQWESRFHSELQEKEADVREAETRAKDLAERLQRETTQKEELQSLLERMQKEGENLQLELSEAEKKHNDSFAALEKERGDLQQNLALVETNLTQTRSQLTTLETEAEGLRHRTKALEEAVDKLQSDANEARAVIKERETEERRLCLRLEQLETDLASSKNLTDTLQAALDEKEKREMELLGEKEQAVTQAVEEARKDADVRAEMAEKELKKKREELRSLEERLRKAEEDTFQSRAQLESFTKAMGSLQDDRDRVLSQYKQLEERHLQVMMDKDSLIQEAAGENNGLKEEIRALLSQRDDLNAENAKLAAQLHGYRNDLKQVLAMKDSQHKQILATQVERISFLEGEKEELESQIQALVKDVAQGKMPPLEQEILSQASEGIVRADKQDAPGAEVEKLREQLQAARKHIATLEETLELEKETQAVHSKELKELRWEGGVLRTEAETAEERVAELARDLLMMEQQLLEEREAASQLRAQNQSFGQAMASLQDARDQAVNEAKELRLRLYEVNQTAHPASPPSGSKGEVWSLKNALSALQNDRERMLEQLHLQRSELDRLGSGELSRLTQALVDERRRAGEQEEKIMAEMRHRDAQMDRYKQELEMLRLERMDWQGQAELLKQQTLTTLSERDQQVRHLTAMLEEARTSKLRLEHTQRQGSHAVDAAPGGPLEHNEGYKAECIELQRRLDEESEQRLRVEEQLIAAQDRLKRYTHGEWQTASEAMMSETAVLIEPPEGAVTRTRSGGPGLLRMLRVAFCSRQRTPLLVSLYLLTVHVLLLLCMGGYL
ncbi:golgin subfamily B member 1-like isoform X3 [Carassius auratus]|uniref:Golgin subfamily B member 1-like isoform X3 n=1 Tax=Carassius auratus TaxID=7957 RepID=A0A6P6LT54_CARAU|nr:golgin subfamily B member 1-like isoform X3 [Carassius auratus]